MTNPNDRVPLGALNEMLRTVRSRLADNRAKIERLERREAELLSAILVERAAAQADLDAATAELEG